MKKFCLVGLCSVIAFSASASLSWADPKQAEIEFGMLGAEEGTTCTASLVVNERVGESTDIGTLIHMSIKADNGGSAMHSEKFNLNPKASDYLFRIKATCPVGTHAQFGYKIGKVENSFKKTLTGEDGEVSTVVVDFTAKKKVSGEYKVTTDASWFPRNPK